MISITALSTASPMRRYVSIESVGLFVLGGMLIGLASAFTIDGMRMYITNSLTLWMWVITALACQACEAVFFVKATNPGMPAKTRVYLGALAAAFFLFGIYLMTFGQYVQWLEDIAAAEAKFQTQNAPAQQRKAARGALDSTIADVERQVSQKHQIIDSYRINADRQSQSIYRDSRQSAQSMLEKIRIEEQEMKKLFEQLSDLRQQRAAMNLSEVPAQATILQIDQQLTQQVDIKFFVLLARSLLIEIGAITLLALAARAVRQNKAQSEDRRSLSPSTSDVSADNSPSPANVPPESAQPNRPDQVSSGIKHRYSNLPGVGSEQGRAETPSDLPPAATAYGLVPEIATLRSNPLQDRLFLDATSEKTLCVAHKVPLTDDDWRQVESLIPKATYQGGRNRRRYDDRAILNGILWVLGNGISWRELPSTFPPFHTCYRRYTKWNADGVLKRLLGALSDSATKADDARRPSGSKQSLLIAEA